jgi:hypothetical protein
MQFIIHRTIGDIILVGTIAANHTRFFVITGMYIFMSTGTIPTIGSTKDIFIFQTTSTITFAGMTLPHVIPIVLSKTVTEM